MENQGAEIEVVKQNQRQTNQQVSKFISALLTLITGCVMLMVNFIWTMKGEFAEEKVRNAIMYKTLEEVRSELKDHSQVMKRISDAQIKLESRLEARDYRSNKIQ